MPIKNRRIQVVPLVFLLLVLYGTRIFSAQDAAEESTVINIEVPVRVFEGNNFVADLSIDDFELDEDGIRQKIEAVYLVNKRTIQRSEENRRFNPDTSRHFYLFFEITDYESKIDEAVQYFVDDVLDSGDSLTFVTPVKTYLLREQALQVISRGKIADQMKGLLRKDALISNSEYRNILNDMSGLAQSLAAFIEVEELGRTQFDRMTGMEDPTSFSPGEKLMKYADYLRRLELLRRIDQKTLLGFSEYLKHRPGQKAIFFFYQREYIPRIENRILQQYQSLYQDDPNILETLQNIFHFYFRDIPFDVDLLKRMYADSSIAIHFLFLATPRPRVYGVRFEEQSEDIFSAFRQMSHATGGYLDSSANPTVLFRNAVQSAEQYYLLYYSPLKMKMDGKFRNITVRIINRPFKVFHRQGYFSN